MSEVIRYEEEEYKCNQSLLAEVLRQKAINTQNMYMTSGTTVMPTSDILSRSITNVPRAISSMEHDKAYQQYLDRMIIKNPVFKEIPSKLGEEENIEQANEYLE